jgi:hypothetical protein
VILFPPNYVVEFQPTNGRQCSKIKKNYKVPFPNQIKVLES